MMLIDLHLWDSKHPRNLTARVFTAVEIVNLVVVCERSREDVLVNGNL